MSTLTEALDRILVWLQKQRREHPEITKDWWMRLTESPDSPLLEPGLSLPEIEEIARDLPIQLPPEIIELYRWRNGSLIIDEYEFDWLFDVGRGWGFFMGMGFAPLQYVVNSYRRRREFVRKKTDENDLPASHWESYSLTIFHARECQEGYVIVNNAWQSCPVICRDYKGGANDVISKYASLTSMMQTIAESYEQAYYIDDSGFYTKDDEKAREIWRKYNAEYWVETTLKSFERVEDKLPELGDIKGFDIIQEVADTLRFSGDARLIPPLIRVLRRPPTNTPYDGNLDYLRSQSSMFLGWVGGTNAVELLIQALTDDYWQTRYWATITLGAIKDPRAIPALVERLQDDREMVREAAQNSLENIRRN